MQKIIGIGNSLVDILAKTDDSTLKKMNLPKGSMQLIDTERLITIRQFMDTMVHTRASGGSASNTIKALARMGAETAFVGKVANDETGDFFCSEMAAAGVDMKAMRKSEGTSGTASTLVSPDGQRTFATFLGISAELSADDITDNMLDDCQMLYVEGYLVQNHDLMERILSLAKVKHITTCLDLASYNIVENDREFFKMILDKYIDIVFANEEEAAAFTGNKPEDAVRKLSELCSIAVVKMGKDGACSCQDGKFHRAPTNACANVVDTTGAGDYFAAGFLYGHIHGWSAEQCLETGNMTASAIIQVMGATLPDIAWKNISEKLKTH